MMRQKLCHRVGMGWPITGLAEVAVARRQMARAATLCAAAQAIYEEASIPISQGVGRRQERTITAARTLLGEAAFAAAWMEGRLMPHDKAIVYALSSNEYHEVQST